MNKYIKLVYKLTLLLLPFFLLFILYVCFDPFKVLYKYESYFQSGHPSYVTLNKDYVSTQTFINNSSKFQYNSFIFGNSRSMFYEINSWKKYIKTDDCFHFDASEETLLGINRKIKFLHNNHVRLANALIILDYSVLNELIYGESKSHLFIAHPALSHQNWLSFQIEFFKSFFSPDFLIAYLDFKCTNKIKDYMTRGYLLNNFSLMYNLKYNEIQYKIFDDLIKNDESAYYNEKKIKEFHTRDSVQKYSPKAISVAQLKMLKEIYSILKEDNTEYKIIISPLYDQKKLDIADIEILNNLFGHTNVFDFSGINHITSDYHNYYEVSHYRPSVADTILKYIYR
jgi:hypothetical protein